MANTKQAKKRAKQAEHRRLHNASRRSSMRTAIKHVRADIVSGNKTEAKTDYRDAISLVDRLANKKLIHKNKAARYKRRLAAQIKSLAG